MDGWFSGRGGAEETITVDPRRMMRKRRRRIQTRTEEPEHWYSKLNPYRYISSEDEKEPKMTDSQRCAKKLAVEAAHCVFKDTAHYALTPGFQLLPLLDFNFFYSWTPTSSTPGFQLLLFLVGMDAFATSLVLPPEEPEQSSSHRSDDYDHGGQPYQKKQEPNEPVMSSEMIRTVATEIFCSP